jgi:hypothetical protein
VGEPENEFDLEDDISSVADCVGVADGPERDCSLLNDGVRDTVIVCDCVEEPRERVMEAL